MQKTRKHALDSQDVAPSKRARKGEPQPQLTTLGVAVRQVPRILVDLIPKWLPLGDLCNLVDAVAYAYMAGQGMRTVSRAFLQKHVVDPATSDEPIVVLHSMASLLFLRKYGLYKKESVYLVDLHKKEDFEYWHTLVEDGHADNILPTFDSWFGGERILGMGVERILKRIYEAIGGFEDYSPTVRLASLAVYAGSLLLESPRIRWFTRGALSKVDTTFLDGLQRSKFALGPSYSGAMRWDRPSTWTSKDLTRLLDLLVTPLSPAVVHEISMAFFGTSASPEWSMLLNWKLVKPLLDAMHPCPKEYFLTHFCTRSFDGLLRVIADVYGPRLLEGACMHISVLRAWMENERYHNWTKGFARALRWDLDQPSGMCTISDAGKSSVFADKVMMDVHRHHSAWFSTMNLDESEKDICLDHIVRWMVDELGNSHLSSSAHTARWTAWLDKNTQTDVFSRVCRLCDRDSTGVLQQKYERAMRVWNDTVDECMDDDEEEEETSEDESPTQSDLDFIASSSEEDSE